MSYFINSLLLAFIFSIHSSSISPAETQRIKIAFQGPLTGSEAPIGTSQLDAMRYVVNKFNRYFKNRIEVEILAVDDQGDPSFAQKVAPNVAAEREILALVGPSYSGTTLTSLPYYKKYLLPMISPSASRSQITSSVGGNESQGTPVFHRIINPNHEQGPAILKLALDGVEKPILFIAAADESPFQDSFQHLIQYIKDSKAGGFDSFSGVTTNFSTNIAKVKVTGANTVVFLGYENSAMSYIKQLRDSGYLGKITLSNFSQEYWPQINLKYLEGVRLSADTSAISDFNFVLESDIRYENKRVSGVYAAETIDATNVILYCISKGSKNRESMLLCIKNYSGLSVYGNVFSFKPNGDPVGQPFRDMEFRNGIPLPLKLPEVGNQFTLSSFPWMTSTQRETIPKALPTISVNDGREVVSPYAKILYIEKTSNKYRISVVSNVVNDSLVLFARKVGKKNFQFEVPTDALGSARFETIRKLSGYQLTVKYDGVKLDSLLVR